MVPNIILYTFGNWTEQEIENVLWWFEIIQIIFLGTKEIIPHFDIGILSCKIVRYHNQ